MSLAWKKKRLCTYSHWDSLLNHCKSILQRTLSKEDHQDDEHLKEQLIYQQSWIMKTIHQPNGEKVCWEQVSCHLGCVRCVVTHTWCGWRPWRGKAGAERSGTSCLSCQGNSLSVQERRKGRRTSRCPDSQVWQKQLVSSPCDSNICCHLILKSSKRTGVGTDKSKGTKIIILGLG